MRRWTELTSFLIGAAAALVVLAGYRVPGGGGSLGAAVALSVERSPLVHISRTGTVVDVRRLDAGGHVTSAVTVTNPGRAHVRLRPRARSGGDAALDTLLRVELRGGDRLLYRGTLADLARPLAAAWELGPRTSGRFVVRLRLPREAAADGYAGRSTQSTIVFEAAQ